ncbi:NAD(P)H-dependent oxidoreductase [Phenylobacterium aquaticum]|uniref:NAD(P)H-dependent oxidoreductase n=1 Tax=Phenylobacterium aquaticum TaxID=1763816 RepID=UPI0026F0E644|nr:NAD(P)H-dependent oxidoreductase [Phenylobacterium aquaticum]
MKHAVIIAHPSQDSFTAAVGRTYAETVRAMGQEVLVRDLYAMDFDPRLKASELPSPKGANPAPDIATERALVADADVFAFIYPFWFNAPPAILKGYADRMFGLGFGYAPASGGTEPLLSSRQLISFSSSGAPDRWVEETGALSALRQHFDGHLAGVCGLNVIDHRHHGGVTPGITDEAVADMLEDVARAVRKAFGPAARTAC